MNLSEVIKRSIFKTATWRITGSAALLVTTYAITGSFAIAGTIGIIHIISNTILYYIHERVWNTVNWGKKDV